MLILELSRLTAPLMSTLKRPYSEMLIDTDITATRDVQILTPLSWTISAMRRKRDISITESERRINT